MQSLGDSIDLHKAQVACQLMRPLPAVPQILAPETSSLYSGAQSPVSPVSYVPHMLLAAMHRHLADALLKARCSSGRSSYRVLTICTATNSAAGQSALIGLNPLGVQAATSSHVPGTAEQHAGQVSFTGSFCPEKLGVHRHLVHMI